MAEARHDPLIEEQRLDRRAPPLQRFGEIAGRESVAERLRPHFGEGREAAQRLGGNDVDRAETARIVKGERPSLLGLEHKMVVRSDLPGIDPPLAVHAEVRSEEHTSALQSLMRISIA